LGELKDVDALLFLAAGEPEEVTYVLGNYDAWLGSGQLKANTEIFRFDALDDIAKWLQGKGAQPCDSGVVSRVRFGTLGPASPWHGKFCVREVDSKNDAILRDPRVKRGPHQEKDKGGGRPTQAKQNEAAAKAKEKDDALRATRAAEAAAERGRLFRQNAATVGVTLAQTPALDDDPRAALDKWYAGFK
jgi:hypothetical protein